MSPYKIRQCIFCEKWSFIDQRKLYCLGFFCTFSWIGMTYSADLLKGPPSNVFFQLVLISWMITLSSCLIWQIISFIFPPNKYGCVHTWTTLGRRPAIDLQKMPILAKNYLFRVTVWCGFWSRAIIGPFFFENEQVEVVTGNGDYYWAMLNEFFFTHIKEEDIGNIWFQQYGSTCHTAEATLDVLRPVFEDCIISRRIDVVWPPLSFDLTPFDYYLWGGDKPETIDSLKDNIR